QRAGADPPDRRPSGPCDTKTDESLQSVVITSSVVRLLPRKTQAPKRPGPIQFALPSDASVDPTEARNRQDLRRRNLHRASSLTVVREDGPRSRTGRFFLITPMVRLEGERPTLPAVGPARDSSSEARARP